MTSKVTSCPAWCIVHRTNDRGWSFHIGEMQYAGGMYVGLQQNRRGGHRSGRRGQPRAGGGDGNRDRHESQPQPHRTVAW